MTGDDFDLNREIELELLREIARRTQWLVERAGTPDRGLRHAVEAWALFCKRLERDGEDGT